MALRRRHLLWGLGVGALTPALPLSWLWRARPAGPGYYGALLPDPERILDLPAGFSYTVLERTGDAMDDGHRVPGQPDGMACFAGPAGTLVLMRNHELRPGDRGKSAYPRGTRAPPQAWTPDGLGAVTRLVLDAASGRRISSNLVLAGTELNCAGGPSPWGWLSCEETVSKGHGYVFRCPLDADSVRAPERILGYGRFRHEAVAIAPGSHVAYLTEDRPDGCLYRFVPDAPEAPFVGRLQAMAVVDRPGLDTGHALAVGETVACAWVDVDEPDPEGDTVRARARARGAAIVVRGEGIVAAPDGVYVSATEGGPRGEGQILLHRFGRGPDDGGTLEIVAQAEGEQPLRHPDNLTLAPWGDVFIAEDNGRNSHLRVLGRDGRLWDFARNARSGSELSGVCLAPGGERLFVNLQHDGLTLAVAGPFGPRA